MSGFLKIRQVYRYLRKGYALRSTYQMGNTLFFKVLVAGFFGLILLSFPGTSWAQAPVPGQASISFIPGDPGYLPGDFFQFPNVNKVEYFEDKKALDELRKLDKKKKWEELFPLLVDYTRQFGIQNFYKDTYLLWRLAKLTELFGNLEGAKRLYKLVLKHHRTDIDLATIELYYDSLNTHNFVPLEYYYELVEYRKEVDTLRPPRGVLMNMGSKINSPQADYGPALNLGRDVFVFTSRRSEKISLVATTNNEDLFISRRIGDKWTEAAPLTEINSRYNEGSVCLSRDGKTLIFSRCGSPDGYGNCDLFSAKMQPDSTWGEIENLGTKVNSGGWDSQPTLSITEDTLFFASDRIGGFGLSDIWFTVRNRNGKWGLAQNAGPVINSRQGDLGPFYHPLIDVFYFSSEGHLLNFGEYDIYKVSKFEGFWGEPKNIGPLVNGAGSEFYFTIDSESRDLFYARSVEHSMDLMDLYSFPLPMGAQPNATTRVTGQLTDAQTGETFNGIVSIIDLDNGIEVAPQFVKDDGTFEFDLINDNNYMIVIQGEEFFRIEEFFHLSGDTTILSTAQHIASRIEFESIEFASGGADLDPQMYPDLNKIVNFLYDNPDFFLRISGHTDGSGSESFNQELSQERAEAIRDYIVKFNYVPGYRVEAVGYGSSKPIVAEENDADKALNRRVEFEIYRDQETIQQTQQQGQSN